jgi:transcriptional regulator with XRE-family HTH domain
MDLRRYLDANDISVAEFAGILDVTVQAVHRYINGERIPKREVMDRIIRITAGRVQPNDFFTLETAA